MLTGFKDKKFALIGRLRKRALPARLHGMLADYSYEYIEVKQAKLRKFLQESDHDGYNLTYPLKEAVIPLLGDMSDAASRIGCVNTVVRRDGILYGENTDYHGFLYLLDNNGIDPYGKKVIILGTGPTAKAVAAALADRGADEIIMISRRGDNNYSTIEMHDDASLLVNTTPVGTSPNVDLCPTSLRYFKDLEAVIDVIYDPFRTELMLQAEEYGIPAIGGLDMLVHHTKLSCELFTGKRVTDLAAMRASASLEAEMKNIVLVGMPGCGKSVVAKELAKALGREVIDTDDEVSKAAGLSIPEIYELFGEDYFRQKEAEIIKESARDAGIVIASGAGAILQVENIKELRRSSTVIFLRREIERLATSSGRKNSRDALIKLYKERIPLYLAASDEIVDLGETPKDTVRSIIKTVYKK